MNIVLSCLMHGRHDTVKRCLEANREHFSTIVCSYTNDEDKAVLEEFGVHSIKAYNHIPSKAQASLYACFAFNPDAVILMGSDDYINKTAYKKILELLPHKDYIGFEDCVFDSNGKHYLWPGYPNGARYGEPVGAGRVMRRDLLDKLNWDIFGGSDDRGGDAYTHKVLKKAARRFITIGTKEGCELIDVKDKDSCTPVSKFSYLKPYVIR